MPVCECPLRPLQKYGSFSIEIIFMNQGPPFESKTYLIAYIYKVYNKIPTNATNRTFEL